jgi:myo-inositol-1(or 4)-monophosphatase
MKWVCQVCGHVEEGDNPPAECPVCHAPASKFEQQSGDVHWNSEHVVGIANDVPDDIKEQLRAEFGERVASLVAAESDEPHEKRDSIDNWRARKQTAIDRIAAGSRDAKIVALGDKLSNMRDIARDYAIQGDELWKIFHSKDRKDHEWHYRGLAESLRELQDTFAYQEFEQLIKQVFG